MSTVKQVNLSDFAEQLAAYTKATLEDQRKAVARAFAESIPALVAASPVDQGLYAQSWDFTVDETKAVIGNYAPYAAVIEYGARPHTPPIAPLLAWAKRVLSDPSQPPDYSPGVWRLARGVQHKISEVGQAPLHILENAIPDIIERMKQELTKLG